MMHKLRKFLRFAFLCTVVISGRTHTFGAVGRITIEKEGKPPTANELALARRAYSVELAVVRVDASTEYMGFRANPVVNASAAVAAYREGDAPPYPFRIFFPKEVRSGKKYPLVLWLHGRGESLSDNECQLAHMQTSIDVLAGPDRPDFYLVAVQCPVETHSWHRPDPRTPHEETPLEMLDKITQALIKGYPIDVDRISILGICTGGEAGFDSDQKVSESIQCARRLFVE
jgi:predicted peptidase